MLSDAVGGTQSLNIDDASYTESFSPTSDLNFAIVSATDANGCLAEIDGQFDIVVSENPEVVTDMEVTKFCNQNVELVATALDPTSDYSYDWINTTGDLIGQGQFVEVVNSGEYTLVTTDINTGCQTSYPVNVLESADELQIDLVNDPNITLSQGEEVQLEVEVNIEDDEVDFIIWNGPVGLDCYDCLSPIARPSSDVTYLVEVTDIYGCTAQLTVNITVTGQAKSLYIPTAFQPGKLGESMFCVFDDGESDATISLEIYDRWGAKVFVAHNESLGSTSACWDGTSGGQLLEQGVYVYKVSVKYPEEAESLLSGSITLIR